MWNWLGIALVVLIGLPILCLLAIAAWHEVRRRMEPALEIVVLGADGGGAALGGAVAQGLARMRAPQRCTHLRMIYAPKTPLEGLAEAVAIRPPHGRFERLIPSRTRTLTLTALPPDPAAGPGIAAEVRGWAKNLGSETFTGRDYGLDEEGQGDGIRLQRLTVPLTVWVADVLAADLTGRTQRILGTESWRSRAQFAVGVERERSEEVDAARGCYLRALDLDAANQGARLNLAALLLDPGAPGYEGEGVPAALGLLDGLVDEGPNPAPRSISLRARYLRATALLQRRTGSDLKGARDAARSLRKAATEEDGDLLRRAQLLEMSIRLERGKDPTPPKAAKDETEGGLYNLACFHSRLGRRRLAAADAGPGRRVKRSRRNAETAHAALADAKARRKEARAARKRMKKPERETGDALVRAAGARVADAKVALASSEEALAEDEKRWESAHSEAMKALKKALRFLRRALDRGDPITRQWAKRDPALDPVRELDGYEELFDES